MNLRNLARGQECQVRLPGICNRNPETTVLAHFRMPGTCGMGMKPPDEQAAWACSACHDAIDGRTKSGYDKTTLALWHAHGVFRTQQAIRSMSK